MKQRIFTLVMMLALVIVTGSAFAANETTVYPGGLYTYNLTGVSSVNAATAVVNYTGNNETITELSSSYTIAAAANNVTVSFTILYGSEGTPATSGDITVVITDGTSTCSNNIKLAVTVASMPSIQLAIVASEDQYCQVKNATPGNNVPASNNQDNTITYTVTPTITNVSGAYSYGYTITIPTDGQTSLGTYTVSYSGPGTYTEGTGSATVTGITDLTNANGVFTVAFKTTTNLATTITGTLSATSMTVTVGGGVYTGTYSPASDVVTVKAMPSIGSFL